MVQDLIPFSNDLLFEGQIRLIKSLFSSLFSGKCVFASFLAKDLLRLPRTSAVKIASTFSIFRVNETASQSIVFVEETFPGGFINNPFRDDFVSFDFLAGIFPHFFKFVFGCRIFELLGESLKKLFNFIYFCLEIERRSTSMN